MHTEIAHVFATHQLISCRAAVRKKKHRVASKKSRFYL